LTSSLSDASHSTTPFEASSNSRAAFVVSRNSRCSALNPVNASPTSAVILIDISEGLLSPSAILTSLSPPVCSNDLTFVALPKQTSVHKHASFPQPTNCPSIVCVIGLTSRDFF